MGIVSRATLPAEFFDRTSAMMLIQPEPQYLYAQLVFMADLQAELRQNPDALSLLAGRGIEGAEGAVVRPFSENQLQLVAADKVRGETIAVSSELASGNVGHTIRMNRPVFANTTYSAASRLVTSNQTISTTPISLTAEQVAITIQRFAGPYDQANSRVAPYGVDRFDAQRSVHDLVATVGTQLSRDRFRFVDTIYAGLFDSPVSTSVLYPGDPSNNLAGGGDAAAFPSATNGYRPLDAESIFRMEQKLTDLFIPRFGDGMYRLIVTPQQARQLRTDPAFQRMSVFQPENNPLKQSYIATLGMVEIFVCSTNTVDTSTVAGVSINHGVMFGPGLVGRVKDGEGCRVVSSTDDNYGETPKVVWLAYEGQSLLDNRFVVGIHSN
jgi:hypothetical protein